MPQKTSTHTELAGPTMASYIALHDYAATDTDEVTLQEGDSIFEVTAVAGSEGWLSGKVERTGATGSFPESYVELAAEPAASAGSAGTDASAPTVTAAEAWTALYDYAATEGDEVSFNEGDFLTNVKTYTDGWLTGTVTRTGESGSFPEAYAEKATTTTAAAAAAPAPASESARDAATDGGGGGGWVALYDYSATEQDEVSFNEGDALADVKAYTDGWLTGTVVRTGASGSFPETYVEKAASHLLSFVSSVKQLEVLSSLSSSAERLLGPPSSSSTAQVASPSSQILTQEQ